MNKQAIIQFVKEKYEKPNPTPFRVGDTVRVHAKIKEGNNSRIQSFEGVVIGFAGQGGDRNFIVRKISFGVGVERIFPVNSPAIEKIQVVRSGHVRRAKLYYLKSRVGKATRLEEKERAEKEGKKSEGGLSASASSPQQELVAAQDS